MFGSYMCTRAQKTEARLLVRHTWKNVAVGNLELSALALRVHLIYT